MSPSAPYPHVFQPLSMGATTFRHRIMVTGHTQLYGENGTLADRHIEAIIYEVENMLAASEDDAWRHQSTKR